jgi:ferric-dicitrate binding protein FerR (iron transport regulator)
MKSAELHRQDPLRAMREAAAPLEDANEAEARARKLHDALSAAIRGVPARRSAGARRRLAVRGAAAALAAAAALVAVFGRPLRKHAEPVPAPVAQAAFVEAPTVSPPAPPPQEADTQEGVISELTGEVHVMRGGEAGARGAQALALRRSDEIATRATGRSRIVLSNGARVTLSGNTRVRLQNGPEPRRDGSAIVLAAGKVDVNVPKLTKGSFSVVTPHAEVVVHGTSFAVEVLEPGARAGETCVAVTEGVVSVRSNGAEVRLGPRERWSSMGRASRCEVKTPIARAREEGAWAAAHADATHVDNGAVASGAAPAPAPIEATSPLAAQNRLFQEAITARQKGDERDAIHLLDELLTRYPDSPLAREADDQRKRAQERLREVKDDPR